MKTISNYFFLLALIVNAAILSSCESETENSSLLYFSEATSSRTKNVTLSTEGETNTSVTVRVSGQALTDFHAEISLDEEYLNAYNKTNETNYVMLGNDRFTFNPEVIIKEGNASSEPVDICIHEFATQGVKYAIPLKVTPKNNTSLEPGENSSHIIILLDKPLRQAVPQLTYKCNMNLEPKESWGLSLANYTLEWWVKMSGFSVNNQAIFNVAGDNELYIRFGDLVYAQGSKYVYNFLQIKTMGSQFDTGDPTAGAGLEANTWYHFAISYDAASGTSLLYMNGVQVAKLSTAAGQNKGVDGVSMVCSGQTYFKNKCEMCQVRMWKTTRTPAQIANNMYAEVDPKDPNLVFYLPMNEGEGATFYDSTGNGHNATAGSNGTVQTSVPWNTYTFSK